MAVNKNRNSIHTLKTTSVGWLAHRNIPNLSIGTGAAFTLQVYVVLSNDIDGMLYAQDGGFSLKLVDGLPVFSMPGFGTLAATASWKLTSNSYVYIAVRHDNGTLTMFLNGLPIAETKVTPTAACTGDFTIGKDFAGGFSLIRVSSKAMTDREILVCNVEQPEPDQACVFQSDCQTAQYKDVSPNHLPIWACGEGAGCGMFTACASFTGAGLYRCKPGTSLQGDQTLLLKLWPQSCQETQRIYTALDGQKELYALELIPQQDASFQLCVTDSNHRLVSDKKLLPSLWQDVAVVFSKGKACLYLDGKEDAQADFTLSATRTEIVVGAVYKEGRHPNQGFHGYMAYTAEFSRALPLEEIAEYADDPPYLYEENLASLLPLDWEEEPELVSVQPIVRVGSVQFCMAADTTPLDTETGVSTRLPDKESPEWSKLDDEDRWTLELFAALAQGLYSNLLGFPDTEISLDQDISPIKKQPFITKKLYDEIISESEESSSDFNPDELEPLEMEETFTANANGHGLPGVLRGIASRVTTFSLGCIAHWLQSHAGLIAAITVAVGSAIIEVTLLSYNSKRPKRKDSKLKVTGICWNHNGDPTAGGLHYHKGGEDKPESMTDTPKENEEKLETTCVLVPSQLKNPTVDITLSYSSSETTSFKGTLDVSDISNSGKLLATGGTHIPFTVAPGGSVTVSISYDVSKLPRDGLHKQTNIWQLRANGEFLTNCDCIIYTLANKPLKPWSINDGKPYSTNEPSYIRTEFLDFFATDNTGQDFRKYAVDRLYKSGFQYDALAGRCMYSDPYLGAFKLNKFVSHCTKTGQKLNCTDCANIISVACAAVGQDLPMAIFDGGLLGRGFSCNKIKAIGTGDWAYPFYNAKTKTGGFNYHQVNVDSSGKPSSMSPIYDACLAVDGGKYPGDAISGAEKKVVLPTGLQACATSSDQVDVPIDKPYTKEVYRERLVANGRICNFAPFGLPELQPCVYRVHTFSSDVSADQLRYADTDSRILWALKTFSLDSVKEDDTQFSINENQSWSLTGSSHVEWVEKVSGYEQAEQRWRGEHCRVEHWHCSSMSEAAARIAAEIAYTANPDIRSGEEDGFRVGDRCFIIGDCCIIFMRARHVFVVTAETREIALAAAQELAVQF